MERLRSLSPIWREFIGWGHLTLRGTRALGRNGSGFAGPEERAPDKRGGADLRDGLERGAMLIETWRSPEIPGYLADFQV